MYKNIILYNKIYFTIDVIYVVYRDHKCEEDKY